MFLLKVFSNRFLKNSFRRRRGAIMVFFALLAPLLLGIIGFAVDAGYLYAQKGKMQDIADAVALAGAARLNESDKDKRDSVILESLEVYLKANGFKDTSRRSHYVEVSQNDDMENIKFNATDEWKLIWCIEENYKDKDGGIRDHLAVCLVRREPTFFIKMIIPEEQSVIVRAYAVAEWVEESGDGARRSRARLVR